MALTVPDAIGRYQILQRLGQGGMGVLYLARDPVIERFVVIKVLRQGLDDDELRERFTREARSAGRLRHINIVTIFDVGDCEGQPFIAMDYIRGVTLAELIRGGAALPLARKLQLMDELCAGLQYAHRAGVIHRDVKPANIMLDDDGVLKILDFGIARLGASGMTQAGAVMGTLNYMAPEQMEGKPIDARADMFSSGAVFYELLSSRRAFPGDMQSGILHRILGGGPEPLENYCPQAPAGLIAIVNRCLQKQPEQRYADMAIVRRELAAISEQIATERHGDPEATIAIPSVPGDAPRAASPPAPKSSRREANRQDLFKLRDEQIHDHLERARRALDRGECREALLDCQQALVIDPDSGPAQDLEDRARALLEDQQIQQWLAEARGELQQGALTAASLLVERALSLNSASPEAIVVRRAVDEARQRFAQERDRARAVEIALETGERDFDAGLIDRAIEAADEALALDAASSRALALKERLAAAGAARRATEEEDRAGGGRAFRPPHARVAEVLRDLRVEALEIERRLEAERPRPEEERPREVANRSSDFLAPASDPGAEGQRAGRRVSATGALIGLVIALMIGAGGIALRWRTVPHTVDRTGAAEAPPATAAAGAEPRDSTESGQEHAPAPPEARDEEGDKRAPPSVRATPRPAAAEGRGRRVSDSSSSSDGVGSPAATSWQGLQLACDHGEAGKCLDLALMYQSGNLVQKDQARAVSLFQRACDGELARACNELGVAYRRGLGGVAPDETRAAALYQRACDAGYAIGCNNLALVYLRGVSVAKDEARAATLFQHACEGGDAAGCSNLGRAYELGQGVSKDEVRAVAQYDRACTAGGVGGCNGLGWMYFRGVGIAKDEARAVRLFQRACNEGNQAGCNNLGLAYQQGRGATQDEARAAELYQRACDGDTFRACVNLGLMLTRGGVVAKDEPRSATLFQRACDGGNAGGCFNLAFAYANGRGVAKDDRRAVALYQRACEGGSPPACTNLGNRYSKGAAGLPQDEVLAARSYQRACDLNGAVGCTRLATMYQQGRGVGKDPTRAAALYLRARDLSATTTDGTAPAPLVAPSRGR
jgi:TPR repeat protein/serine/threonine protein kinase